MIFGVKKTSTSRGDTRWHLTQPDVTEPLEAIRGGGGDVIRRSVERVLQALIEAEATEVI